MAPSAAASTPALGRALWQKKGAGTWTLSGNNTYGGSTTINAGTLALSGLGTLGKGVANNTLVMSGGQLDLGGGNATVSAVTISSMAASGNTIQNGNLTITSLGTGASFTSGNAVVTANLIGGTGGISVTTTGRP